jgi:hypothetical protein
MRPITRFLSIFWIFRYLTGIFFGWRWERRLYPENNDNNEEKENKRKIYRRAK